MQVLQCNPKKISSNIQPRNYSHPFICSIFTCTLASDIIHNSCEEDQCLAFTSLSSNFL